MGAKDYCIDCEKSKQKVFSGYVQVLSEVVDESLGVSTRLE